MDVNTRGALLSYSLFTIHYSLFSVLCGFLHEIATTSVRTGLAMTKRRVPAPAGTCPRPTRGTGVPAWARQGCRALRYRMKGINFSVDTNIERVAGETPIADPDGYSVEVFKISTKFSSIIITVSASSADTAEVCAVSIEITHFFRCIVSGIVCSGRKFFERGLVAVAVESESTGNDTGDQGENEECEDDWL